MSNKILFVDDDQALLNSFERNLSFDYNIHTATGGRQAIETVKAHGPFSVVVVDMRMPELDGIRTIQALRTLQKNTIYLMLTGNQDYETVLKAVNDGEVFRFLNKPCSIDEIKKAIDGAQTQHDLVMAEKSLLQETLVGSIGVLTDLIEMQEVQFFDCNRMVDSAKRIAKALKLEIGWEEAIAARVCLAGMVLLPNDQRQKLYELDARDTNHQDLVNRVCRKSAVMIEKIPRMGRVSRILNQFPDADGFISSAQDAILLHANILRGVFYWHLLAFRGFNSQQAIQEVKFLMPNLCLPFQESILALPALREEESIEVELDELQPGMVTCQNIYNQEKQLILASERRLTETLITNLKKIRDVVPPRIKVSAGTCLHG